MPNPAVRRFRAKDSREEVGRNGRECKYSVAWEARSRPGSDCKLLQQVLFVIRRASRIRILAAAADWSSPNWFSARRVQSPQSRFQKRSKAGDLFLPCSQFPCL